MKSEPFVYFVLFVVNLKCHEFYLCLLPIALS
jgi:hypothetical protein